MLPDLIHWSYKSRKDYQITKLVQLYPYWLRGRLILFRAAINERRYLLAYSEALAAITLARSTSERMEAKLALGIASLRLGDAEGAETHLRELLEVKPDHFEAIEELAAALISLDKKEEALKRLSSLPVAYRSAESKAALEYLRKLAQ